MYLEFERRRQGDKRWMDRRRPSLYLRAMAKWREVDGWRILRSLIPDVDVGDAPHAMPRRLRPPPSADSRELAELARARARASSLLAPRSICSKHPAYQLHAQLEHAASISSSSHRMHRLRRSGPRRLRELVRHPWRATGGRIGCCCCARDERGSRGRERRARATGDTGTARTPPVSRSRAESERIPQPAVRRQGERESSVYDRAGRSEPRRVPPAKLRDAGGMRGDKVDCEVWDDGAGRNYGERWLFLSKELHRRVDRLFR